jgi:hypothetical protein
MSRQVDELPTFSLVDDLPGAASSVQFQQEANLSSPGGQISHHVGKLPTNSLVDDLPGAASSVQLQQGVNLSGPGGQISRHVSELSTFLVWSTTCRGLHRPFSFNKEQT